MVDTHTCTLLTLESLLSCGSPIKESIANFKSLFDGESTFLAPPGASAFGYIHIHMCK